MQHTDYERCGWQQLTVHARNRVAKQAISERSISTADCQNGCSAHLEKTAATEAYWKLMNNNEYIRVTKRF